MALNPSTRVFISSRRRYSRAKSRLPRLASRVPAEQLPDGRDDHRADPAGQGDDGQEEDGREDQGELEELPRRRGDLLALEGEGERDHQPRAEPGVGDGQGPEGELPDALVLGVEGIVFELDAVIDLAVEKVGEHPGVEELAPAGGDEPALAVEVDVVRDRRADPEHQVLGRGLGLGLLLALRGNRP